MCVQGDSGLVLTTDPKPRLRWTVELHERFIDVVAPLGGPDSTHLFLMFFYFMWCKLYMSNSMNPCSFKLSLILLFLTIQLAVCIYVLLNGGIWNKASIIDFDLLLFTLCKKKHVMQAQKFFDQIKSRFSLTAKTYSILISGWGKVGDSGKARELFEEMLEQGCDVDLLAYNNMLDALCKGGHVDKAMDFFNDVLSKSVGPDAFTYSIFIRAYCDADNFTLALKCNCTEKKIHVDQILEVLNFYLWQVQKHFQLRIEAQGKYMQSILEKAYHTLAGENMAAAATNFKGINGSDEEQFERPTLEGFMPTNNNKTLIICHISLSVKAQSACGVKGCGKFGITLL
ncbi:pentatricopeptide repeat-containing protein At5g12100, mitochondrial-like [Vicia villosa]|uniref:pentatricopeptide repeat-containing protein At5g12100, mitochondrial-like n=1 Tax=Vicia villosa TaxID=3911 RepID=UPI00273AB6BB|nr:pentatricopeptide repeat-containing protein At5g12100, mitochondrial-like [Vicia villosa]